MDQNEKSFSVLLRDLLNQVSGIVRDEARLARAEISEKLSQAGSGAVLLGLALVMAIGAVVILLVSAVVALQAAVATWLAALIVGVAAAVLAAGFAAKGMSNLKARNLMPARTRNAVVTDAHFVREKISDVR